MISPSSLDVFALKFLQKSMILTPWGPSAVPTGGAGVAFPAAIWSFTIACTFFAIQFFRLKPEATASVTAAPVPISFVGFRLQAEAPLQLLYLEKVQFHRRRAAKDGHHDLEGVPVEVHFVHRAVEARE